MVTPTIAFTVGEKVKLTYQLEGQRVARTAVVLFMKRKRNTLTFDAGPGGKLTLELRDLTEIVHLPTNNTTFLYAGKSVDA